MQGGRRKESEITGREDGQVLAAVNEGLLVRWKEGLDCLN